MAESIFTYAFYPCSLEDQEKMEIVEELYDSVEFQPAEELETVREDVETFETAVLSFGYRSISPGIEIAYRKNTEHLPDVAHMRLALSNMYYEPGRVTDEEVTEHVADWIALSRELYDASRAAGYPAPYVIGADPDQVDALHGNYGEVVAPTTEGVLDGVVEHLYWFQILPPNMVDAIGRERLLSAPGVRVEELPDRGILLVAYDRPVPSGTVDEIEDYLGLGDSL